MKHLFMSALLVALLYTLSVEATSEPVCSYEPTGEPIRRWQEVIIRKGTTGCERQVTCDEDYKIAVTECSPILCPADKALDNDVFPECCCL